MTVLPTSRRSVSPTAMGRTAIFAPAFFNSFAPHKYGAASAGNVPRSAVMQNSSRASRSSATIPASFLITSWRCWGRSPYGPAALPRGNCNMHCLRALSLARCPSGEVSTCHISFGNSSAMGSLAGCNASSALRTSASAESWRPVDSKCFATLENSPSSISPCRLLRNPLSRVFDYVEAALSVRSFLKVR